MARGRMAVAVAVCATLLVACSRHEGTSPPPRRDERLVVASFNFAESRLLAEIYAAALEDRGVAVRRDLDLGPREIVQPALEQGLVDVVPEYLGSALRTYGSVAGVDAGSVTAVRDALAAAAGARRIAVLDPAPAQNQNAVVVTSATASRLALARISDLAPVSATVVVGGPPECPDRPYCLAGLRERYGLTFARFVPLEGESRVRRALEEGVIDVGVMFTTDGQLASSELVALEDDKRLQPVENVVALVRAGAAERHGSAVREALNSVSSRLTTAAVRFLNWRVTVAGNDARGEARAWLRRQGLIRR